MKTNNVGLIPNNARRKLWVASTYALFIALITSCCFTHSFAAGPDDWPATETFTPEGIAMPIEGDVMRSSALSCRPGIQISLNHFGYGVVTPTSMLYVMNFPENMYEVTVDGGSDTVTCADIGSTLMATVREIPTGNTCMTELTVEDKLPPFLSCSADTLPCNVDIQSLDFLSFIDVVFDNCTPIEDVEITYAYTVTELDCDPDGIAAIIVPPILVPLLLRFFQKSRQEKQTFK